MFDFNNKIAIVGLGSIGTKHLRLLRKLRPELDITIVRSGHGKEVVDERIADRTVRSIDEAISLGIKAAIISSPASLHLEQSIKLAKAKIHLFIEKPLSTNTERIDQLLKIVEKNNLIVLIGYVFRHNLGAKKFNSLLKDNKIGDILHVKLDSGSYLPSWRKDLNYKNSVSSKKELGGGVLFELSHELDMISWFFPSLITLIGFLNNSGSLGIDVEDCVDINFKAEENYILSAHIDFNTRFSRRKFIVHGSRGDLMWDALNDYVEYSLIDKDKELIKFDNERTKMYENQFLHFFDCIEKGLAPAVSIDHGSEIIKMIESIIESDFLGKIVTIK